MQQPLGNLLANAIKFSRNGGEVEVRLYDGQLAPSPGGEPRDALAFEVRDRGVGVPEDEPEQVFDKVVQSGKTRSGAGGAGGTGPNLSICREIVALHAGTIAAADNPGGGACFSVTLPRHASPASE